MKNNENINKGKHSASKIKLAGFDDLFGESSAEGMKIIEIPLSDLYKYHNHPFKVLDDEKMEETVESIKQYGVLVPGIARPRKESGYEIVAGHRRKRGCELAGLSSMPVIVKELNDDEADIIMVDSNIQRENLLFSEKAFAYKIKFEAMKHQGSKGKAVSTTEIGEQSGESGRQVQRYIRLTKLHEDILKLVDCFKIKFIPAEKLSYLAMNEQEWLLKYIEKAGIYPSESQASKLKQYSESKELTSGMVELIMAESKNEGNKVVISAEKIKQYFSPSYSKQNIEEIIFQLLEQWKASH